MKQNTYTEDYYSEYPNDINSSSDDKKNVLAQMQYNQNNKEQNSQKSISNKSIENSDSNENIEINQNSNKITSDISAQITELKSMIDSRNHQFESEFEELKRSHQAKLKMLKQNHITREQTKSNSYDLEYRNLIWTTTLKHLNRGCFTEDLRLLYQQAISDEQYQLEKEILKIKQKNDDEIQYMKENIPKIHLANKSKRNFIKLDIMDPTEMAQIIFNNCFPESGIVDKSELEIQMIEKITQKVQKNSNLISSIHYGVSKKPLKEKSGNLTYKKREKFSPRNFDQDELMSPKTKLSPQQKKSMKYQHSIEAHQLACKNLELSVQKTDKFIKNLQNQEWFNDIFPHVEDKA